MQLRDQFNGLKALIDAQAAATTFGRVAADWTSGTSSFAKVGGLAFAVAAGESWSAELVLAVVSGLARCLPPLVPYAAASIKAGSDLLGRRTG